MDVPKIVVELAVSSGGARSFGSGATDTTSATAAAVAETVDEATTAGKAVDSTVAETVDEARPPGIAKYSAATAATAVDSTVAETVEEARPRGIAKYSATTAATAVDSTVAETVEEARPPGIAKYSATTAATAVDSTVAETVEEAPHPGIAKYSERISEQSGFVDDVTKISSRDWNLQRTEEQFLVDSVEVDKVVLPERVSERISDRSEVVNLRKISSQNQNLQRTGEQSLVDSVRGRMPTKGGQFQMCQCVDVFLSRGFFSGHRRTSVGNALLSVRSHVACVSAKTQCQDPMPILCQILARRTLVLYLRSMLEAFKGAITTDEGRI